MNYKKITKAQEKAVRLKNRLDYIDSIGKEEQKLVIFDNKENRCKAVFR